MSKKTGSKQRVIDFANEAGTEIQILEMDASTRTAEEAAAACGCIVDQIVKSLIFQGVASEKLYLFLVSGKNKVDMQIATKAAGEELKRAEPKTIRSQTGFAIGGVAPFGAKAKLPTWIDQHLISFDEIWAAAGAPNAVFAINPNQLLSLTEAEPIVFDS